MGKTAEQKANDWLQQQEEQPRPGSIETAEQAPRLLAAQGLLSPVIEYVHIDNLKPNPLNDFPPLPPNELADLKRDIAANGILEALIVRRDGVLITGANRLTVTTELVQEGRPDLAKVPVRYVNVALEEDDEYEIIEGDNLLRRHLSPQQRRRRIVERIKRLYADELVRENRGGNPKIDPQFLPKNLADEVSKTTGIPKGTAQHYVRDARKEMRQDGSLAPGVGRARPVKLTPKQWDQVRTMRQEVLELRREQSGAEERARAAKEALAAAQRECRAIDTRARGLLRRFSKLVADLRQGTG